MWGLTSVSGNCVKSANGEFPVSSCASRLVCAVMCGETRGGTFKENPNDYSKQIAHKL